MGVSEVRTQIYLPREQHRALKRAAERHSVSMARLIRDAVADYLERDPEPASGLDRRDAALTLIERAERIGGSGLPDADAGRLEEELYGPVHR
jgi:predicted transcriptional regulator